jgi:riboflavin synthase alpha subunit
MRGSEVPLWKCHSTITYQFQQSMLYHQIGKHLNVEKDIIKRIIQRAKKRAKSLSIEDL